MKRERTEEKIIEEGRAIAVPRFTPERDASLIRTHIGVVLSAIGGKDLAGDQIEPGEAHEIMARSARRVGTILERSRNKLDPKLVRRAERAARDL